MNYADSENFDVTQIPVIDIQSFKETKSSKLDIIVERIIRAAEEVGFFYICNHGIPESVLEKAYIASKVFFKKPLEWKNLLKINENHHGFLALGGAKMESATLTDLKESFVWGLDLPDTHASVSEKNPFLGKNQWPYDMPELKKALYAYFEAGLECGKNMMRLFAMGMGIPDTTFIQNIEETISRGSVIYYPPQPEEMGKEQFGVSPHTDYGCLTLLWQDHVGGLEILNRKGAWVRATPIKGTLVVNVGDLLRRWTNDGFLSTEHRVINRQDKERHSMVIAWDPNFDTMINPMVVCNDPNEALHNPVLCGDYVLSRFDSSFNYRNDPPQTF